MAQKKWYNMANSIIQALENGSILIIDELSSFHPLLARHLVALFNSQHNSKNAQLIFTTHDTSLLSLDEFRRDQIWFTQKMRNNSTELYSLVDFEVRNSKDILKGYLQEGRYGALPVIRDFT